jgi:hypothetical protein
VPNPFARPSGSELYLVRAAEGVHGDDESVWWSRTEPSDEEVEPEHAHERDIMRSLDQLAETIDRLAAQLDAHHDERAERLEAIEFLLREVVLGAAPAPRAVVLGGVIDPAVLEPADITVIADPVPLEIDTPVEVRSRFHDRWIVGFAIAEAIEAPLGTCRYRLTRLSDGIPLPILFEACDVRAAAIERLPVEP